MIQFKTITPDILLPICKEKFSKAVDWERCLILYDKIQMFASYKKNKEFEGASISISYLRSILGSKEKTKIIIDAMKSLGVISIKSNEKTDADGNIYISESYVPGRNAKVYLINDKFKLTKENQKVRYVTEKLNNKALNKALNQKNYQKKLYEPALEHIWLNLQNIGIDSISAEKYISQQFKDVSPTNYQRMLQSISKIENQAIDFHRGSNGRLVTTLTNMKKELRQFLYDRNDNKSDFIEVDISNSQPLFISIYLEENYRNFVSTPDFLSWKQKCQDGIIYDYIASEINFSREFVKDRFMDVLLFTAKNKSYLLERNNLNPENQSKKMFLVEFIKLFPTIWELLLKVKTDIGNREFALKIQKMEAELMIDKVLMEFNDIGTHFSIHDSIVCRTADIDYVSEQINRAFKFKHKYLVKLKIKSLH